MGTYVCVQQCRWSRLELCSELGFGFWRGRCRARGHSRRQLLGVIHNAYVYRYFRVGFFFVSGNETRFRKSEVLEPGGSRNSVRLTPERLMGEFFFRKDRLVTGKCRVGSEACQTVLDVRVDDLSNGDLPGWRNPLVVPPRGEFLRSAEELSDRFGFSVAALPFPAPRARPPAWSGRKSPRGESARDSGRIACYYCAKIRIFRD